jgi:hypothetical protein
MSTPAAPTAEARWAALPAWLRPRDVERVGGEYGSPRTRLIETTLLLLVAVLLATATVNDVVRQRNVNERLIADLRTWRNYTRHDYHNLTISQELLGPTSSRREVVCGNTTPGAPKANIEICLAIWGPVVNGRRTVHGGWYLPAKAQDDTRSLRYGCFGPASHGMCPK